MAHDKPFATLSFVEPIYISSCQLDSALPATFKNSAFPYISHPVISDKDFIRIMGVSPISKLNLATILYKATYKAKHTIFFNRFIILNRHEL